MPKYPVDGRQALSRRLGGAVHVPERQAPWKMRYAMIKSAIIAGPRIPSETRSRCRSAELIVMVGDRRAAPGRGAAGRAAAGRGAVVAGEAVTAGARTKSSSTVVTVARADVVERRARGFCLA